MMEAQVVQTTELMATFRIGVATLIEDPMDMEV